MEGGAAPTTSKLSSHYAVIDVSTYFPLTALVLIGRRESGFLTMQTSAASSTPGDRVEDGTRLTLHSRGRRRSKAEKNNIGVSFQLLRGTTRRKAEVSY